MRCAYDAAATNNPANVNSAYYDLTLTNSTAQPMRVTSVAVSIWHSGSLVGTDNPVYEWKPVAISPGAAATQTMPVHQVLSLSGSWTCSLAN